MTAPNNPHTIPYRIFSALAVLILISTLLLVGCGGAIRRLPGLRGDCEDVRLRCVDRCEDKYQSSLGEREYCTRRCNWEYRQCTD